MVFNKKAFNLSTLSAIEKISIKLSKGITRDKMTIRIEQNNTWVVDVTVVRCNFQYESPENRKYESKGI